MSTGLLEILEVYFEAFAETDAAYRTALAIAASRSRERASDRRHGDRPFVAVLVSSA